jgi:microcystin-dependent protein
VTGGVNGGSSGVNVAAGGFLVPAGNVTIDIVDAGSDAPHNNVQPTIILNYIIWAAA